MSEQKLAQEKVFLDPIHDFIQVQDQVILDLINTAEFQRLRRVRATSIANMVFHGAEHSRFSHSLGAYEIARRITSYFGRHFVSQTPDDGLWHPEERLVTITAALLHDVGHGAFSHTFEHIFDTDHEAWTQDILTGDTQINQVLRRVSPNFPNEVASVIAKTYKNKQVVQLISSQLDVDRMDYLLRDTYFTGTKYGEFDLDRILRTLRPVQDGIVVDYNGLHAVEDYITSRYQMYLQVYFHPASRGLEVLLEHLLERAQTLYDDARNTPGKDLSFVGPFLTPLFAGGKLTLEAYLALDDNVFWTYINLWQQHPDPILSDLARRFMTRKPLKSILVSSDADDLIDDVRDLVEKAGYPADFYTAENDAYDLPYDDYQPNAAKPRTQIDLLQKDGTRVELSTVSKLVAAIKGQASIDQRFFFPKEMLQVDGTDLLTDVRQEFQNYIKNDILVRPNEKQA